MHECLEDSCHVEQKTLARCDACAEFEGAVREDESCECERRGVMLVESCDSGSWGVVLVKVMVGDVVECVGELADVVLE